MTEPGSTDVDSEIRRRELISASDELEMGAHGLHPGGNHAMSPTTIQGWQGGEIDFLDPDPSSVRLADVARGLSTLRRFAGQTETFYSVAEHSVLVLDVFDGMYPGSSRSARRYALLHDAHEAYFGDLTSPLKRAIEQAAGNACVTEIEQAIEEAVLIALLVPEPSIDCRAAVKRCDLRARFCEGRVLKPREETWDTPDCVLPDGVTCQFRLDWRLAEDAFLMRCKDLGITEVGA
jgi:hypothetical protein